QPIVAYQFNPVEGEAAFVDNCPTVAGSPKGCWSYSTDASLLLPWHALFGSSYVVTGFPGLHQGAFPPSAPSGPLDMGDFVAIAATEANSSLTIKLRPGQKLLPWLRDPQIVPGEAFPMKQGQVLELFTAGKSPDETLSGTEIVSGGKPLHVVSGMACASIPLDPDHCGHMEDVVVPKETLGKEYVVPVLH